MPNSSKFTCSVCWHEAESLRALERHWAIHLSHYSGRNDRGFYGCGMCGREFSGLNSLRKGPCTYDVCLNPLLLFPFQY